MIKTTLKHNVKCPICRTPCARFHLPNGLKGLTHREKCELLAEQLTHDTDDEDRASA